MSRSTRGAHVQLQKTKIQMTNSENRNRLFKTGALPVQLFELLALRAASAAFSSFLHVQHSCDFQHL
jgi:hypothetical protein